MTKKDERRLDEGIKATIANALHLAQVMMRDSWATGDDAAWQPAYHRLEKYLLDAIPAQVEMGRKLGRRNRSATMEPSQAGEPVENAETLEPK